MLQIPRCTLTLITFLFVSHIFSPSDTLAGSIAGTGSDVANYFRVIWGLLVVLGIILILYGFVRKRFSLLTTSATQEIKVVEIKPLMGKKALCLINIKGQEHLLGISGDRITHIANLTSQSESSFAEVLQATGAPPQL